MDTTAQTRHDVIAIGASAGGVEALRALIPNLGSDLAAAVFVVLHVPPTAPSALPAILTRVSKMPVTHAVDGEPVLLGRVYIAPPDRHMLVVDGHIKLTIEPAENGHRPAIDPLFRSVARVFGDRVIGVVLSGSRGDGAGGLASIAARGGRTIVQDPEEALHPSMPLSAMREVEPDDVLSVTRIGDRLMELTGGVSGVGPDNHIAPSIRRMPEPTADDASPSGFGCPVCGGALFIHTADAAVRYQCRIGHAWSPDSLLIEHQAALESALWMALRALEEKAQLANRMAGRSSRYSELPADRYKSISKDATRAAETIRELINAIIVDGLPVEPPIAGTLAGRPSS